MSGEVTLQDLKTFSEELFHPDHGASERHAVIIQMNDPSNDMEMFFHYSDYELFLSYINGNPLFQKDLKRVSSIAKYAYLKPPIWFHYNLYSCSF